MYPECVFKFCISIFFRQADLFSVDMKTGAIQTGKLWTNSNPRLLSVFHFLVEATDNGTAKLHSTVPVVVSVLFYLST